MTVSSAKAIYVLFYHLHQFAIKSVQHQYGTPGQRIYQLPLFQDFVAPSLHMVFPDNEHKLDLLFCRQHFPVTFHFRKW